jgi:hypothetical protein
MKFKITSLYLPLTCLKFSVPIHAIKNKFFNGDGTLGDTHFISKNISINPI